MTRRRSSPPKSRGSSRPSRRSQGLTVRELVEDRTLGVRLNLAAGRAGLERVVKGTRIQKSGLALAGHFHGIESSRIQILGVTEQSYLRKLPKAKRCQAAQRFFELELCCVIVTQCDQACEPRQSAIDELVAAAKRTHTPLLLSPERSSRTIVALHDRLDERLAPRVRVHGVLVDVFEVGLLLLGRSGVGKSEVALELVMRGHRCVADDVVDCHYRPPGMVFGAPADLLRHHLEVRGLGILNIKDLFGVTAIRERKRVDLVVRLVEEDGAAEMDRLGLDCRFHQILGVDIPELSIIVRPGRDMASIMEIAARNELLRRAGHRPEADFAGQFEAGPASGEPDSDTVLPPVRPIEDPSRGSGEELPGHSGMPSEAPPPPESSVGLPYSRDE